NINLKSIGQNIIQGLIDGIMSLKNRVLQKAKEIAEGIKDRIADILWIFSPSRVMVEMGEYIGEGLAIGIENSVDRVRRASDQMAQAATPTQTSAASGANLAGGRIFNPTVNVYGAGPDPQSMGREMIRQLMNYERLQGWR